MEKNHTQKTERAGGGGGRFNLDRGVPSTVHSDHAFGSHGLESLEPRVLMHGGGEVDPVYGPVVWSADVEPRALVAPVNPGGEVAAGVGHEDHVHEGAAVGAETGPAEPVVVHPDNPEKRDEHEALMSLVPVEEATHVAVQWGSWTAASTWADMDGDGVGDVPGDGARVHIPEGIKVIIGTELTTRVKTIRVDGYLRFYPYNDTQLMVDTLVVSPSGELIIGTAQRPIGENVTAKIVITDDGPIDTDWDPQQLSRGVISHGKVRIYGTEKTPFVALSRLPKEGDTALELAEVPANWQVGDQILVTGTDAIRDKNDVVYILAIEGTTVTVDPLQYSYDEPAPGGSLYVANMSRNVVITSENKEDVTRHGHVMFMHSPKVQVHAAAFDNLGRTDKRFRIDDAVLDDEGRLVAGTGLNVRGRYAVHFHRSGAALTHEPAVITGSVVTDGAGWGFVNHDSYVQIEDNISYNVLGAGFVAEDGNEVGTFKRNLAVRSRGSGEAILDRENIFDMGHSGHGFWFQGAGIEVEGNIAVGHHDAGMIFFTRHNGETFEASNLVDPTLADGRVRIPIGEVPIVSLKDNVVFASRTGLEIWQHLLTAEHEGRSVVEGLLVWGVRDRAVNLQYARGITLRGIHATGNIDAPAGVGIDRNIRTADITYEDVHLRGWEVGLLAPLNGDNVIDGGFFRNIDNIVIEPSLTQPRTIEIKGDIRVGLLSEEALGGREQRKIALMGGFNIERGDLWRLFRADTILLHTSPFFNKQLYFPQQATDFVPFVAGATSEDVPAEFLGKTNQQLWDEYGLALGGAVAPVDAVTDSKIEGLIGTRATYLPDIQINSGRYTTRVDGRYWLAYDELDGSKVLEKELIDLDTGWNALVREIGGRTRTLLIFGDDKAPTFEPDYYDRDLSIKASEISQGFTVEGFLSDDSFTTRYYRERFTGSKLSSLPLQTRSNGSKFLLLEFEVNDKAGNIRHVAVQLDVIP